MHLITPQLVSTLQGLRLDYVAGPRLGGDGSIFRRCTLQRPASQNDKSSRLCFIPPTPFPTVLVSCIYAHATNMSFVAARPSASAPSDGSRTITLRDSQPREDDGLPSGDDGEIGSLHLRGVPRVRNRHRPSVVWRDDVVDNEGAGKKSSKSKWLRCSLRSVKLLTGLHSMLYLPQAPEVRRVVV